MIRWDLDPFRIIVDNFALSIIEIIIILRNAAIRAIAINGGKVLLLLYSNTIVIITHVIIISHFIIFSGNLCL